MGVRCFILGSFPFFLAYRNVEIEPGSKGLLEELFHLGSRDYVFRLVGWEFVFGEDGGWQRGGVLGAFLSGRWGCLRGHCCDVGREGGKEEVAGM